MSPLRFLLALAVGSLSFALHAAAPPGRLTEQQGEQVRRAEALFEEARHRARKGDLAQATNLIRQQYSLLRRLLGQHPRVAHALGDLARLEAARGDWRAAVETQTEALHLWRTLHGPGHWRVVTAQVDLRECQLRQGLLPAQREDLRQAAILTAQLNGLMQRGEHRAALPLARQLLGAQRRALGERHRDYALALLLLASLHTSLGEIELAEALHRRALAVQETLFGADHPELASTLHAVAHGYQNRGDAGRARPLYERALAIRRRTLGIWHLDTALTMNNLANCYIVHGQPRRAIPLHAHALEAYRAERGDRHADTARSMHNLANAYQEINDLEKAKKLYQDALSVRLHVLGRKHAATLMTLNNLGNVHVGLGEFQRGVKLHEDVLQLRRSLLGERDPETLQSAHNLACACQEAGDLNRARHLYEAVLNHRRDTLGQRHPDTVMTLNNLANVFTELGDHDQAIKMHEEALAIRRGVLHEQHPDTLQSLHNLACALQERGDYARALPLYHRSLWLRRQVLRAGDPAILMTLNNLANLYSSLGDRHRALFLHERVLADRRATLGNRHPDTTQSMNNLAWGYERVGLLDRAATLLVEARAIRLELFGRNSHHLAGTLEDLARVRLRQGKRNEAVRLAREAIAALGRHLDDTLGALSERQRLRLVGHLARYLDLYLSLAAPDAAPAEDMYAAALIFKGVLSSRTSEEREADGNRKLRLLLDDLARVRADLARLAYQAPRSGELRDRWRKQIEALEAEKERIEVLLAGTSAIFGNLRKARQPTAAAVIAALPEGVALVELVRHVHLTPPATGGEWSKEPRFLAFVLRRGSKPVCLSLGPADPIDKAVEAWRQALRGGRTDAAAARLRRLVWEPVSKHLGKAGIVLVAPDGALCGLPFAALPGRKEGTYLLDEVAIGYLTSGRQLLDQAARSRPDSAGLLVLGGIDFGAGKAKKADGRERSQPWQELPGTVAEAQQVMRLYRAAFGDANPTQWLAGDRAGRIALLQALDPARSGTRWRWLHLATHGYFGSLRDMPSGAAFDRNPLLLAGLVLAGANESQTRGLLTAEEIAALDLRGCDLAVLSACETALGRQAGWQGVQGLQRAFHDAGARTLVASLWNVNDAATSVLMEEFYRRLWGKEKLSPLVALQQAQRQVLRHPEAVHRRTAELRTLLLARGVSEPVLAARGIGKQAVALPAPGTPARSPIAWWAPWVLSGAVR